MNRIRFATALCITMAIAGCNLLPTDCDSVNPVQCEAFFERVLDEQAFLPTSIPASLQAVALDPDRFDLGDTLPGDAPAADPDLSRIIGVWGRVEPYTASDGATVLATGRRMSTMEFGEDGRLRESHLVVLDKGEIPFGIGSRSTLNQFDSIYTVVDSTTYDQTIDDALGGVVNEDGTIGFNFDVSFVAGVASVGSAFATHATIAGDYLITGCNSGESECSEPMRVWRRID